MTENVLNLHDYMLDPGIDPVRARIMRQVDEAFVRFLAALRAAGATAADTEKLTGRELIAKYDTLEVQAAARAVDQAWRGARFGFRDKGLR